MKLRFCTEENEFVLIDPEAVESAIFGWCLNVPSYYVVTRRKRYFVAFPGSFRVRDCIACEQLPEQGQLGVMAA